MKLSSKLSMELNQEFDPTQMVLRKHVYGSNKRRLEIKKQTQAKKLLAGL